MSKKVFFVSTAMTILSLAIAACAPVGLTGGESEMTAEALDAGEFFEDITIEPGSGDFFLFRFTPLEEVEADEFMLEVDGNEFACEVDPENEGSYLCEIPASEINAQSEVLIIAVSGEESTAYLVGFNDIEGLGLFDDDDEAMAANDHLCTGTIGDVTVNRFDVPEGETCTLNGTTVLGAIKVAAGATLIANDIDLRGNIQADSAARIEILDGSETTGNLMTNGTGVVIVDASSIGGNLMIRTSTGDVQITGNSISGNLQLLNNNGSILVEGNTLNGIIRCRGNAVEPVGGGNEVSGPSGNSSNGPPDQANENAKAQASGQCADLY